MKDSERIARLAANLDRVDVIEWARLAAFVDGEGSIMIQRGHYASGRHIYGKLSITNTDPRLGMWLSTLFGGKAAWAKPNGPRCKAHFVWSVSSRHAEFLIRRIRPYLLLKAEQADVFLALRDTVRLGRNQYRGEGISEQEQQIREDLLVQSRMLNRRGVPDGQ